MVCDGNDQKKKTKQKEEPVAEFLLQFGRHLGRGLGRERRQRRRHRLQIVGQRPDADAADAAAAAAAADRRGAGAGVVVVVVVAGALRHLQRLLDLAVGGVAAPLGGAVARRLRLAARVQQRVRVRRLSAKQKCNQMKKKQSISMTKTR